MKSPRLMQAVALSAILVMCFAASALATVGDHTITSVTPDHGPEGVTVSVTIAGSGFAADEAVLLQKTGASDINGTGVVVNSSSELTCIFSLPYSSHGVWNVTARNSSARRHVRTASRSTHTSRPQS